MVGDDADDGCAYLSIVMPVGDVDHRPPGSTRVALDNPLRRRLEMLDIRLLRAPNRFGQLSSGYVAVQDVSLWQHPGSWMTSCGR